MKLLLVLGLPNRMHLNLRIKMTMKNQMRNLNKKTRVLVVVKTMIAM